MSQRIQPVETEGRQVPTFWDMAAETLRELDEEEQESLRQFDADVQTAESFGYGVAA